MLAGEQRSEQRPEGLSCRLGPVPAPLQSSGRGESREERGIVFS